jgi:YrbI family 3-deoxy-D-manno-octulosonate 8-phosphate phosphatase
MSKTIAFVPVRAASKSIPLKNIKKFNGQPLLFWVLNAANNSVYIDEIIVSTDSKEITEIVESFNLKKTIVVDRDSSLAQDTTSTEDVMLDYSKNSYFDTIILLQATSPLTTSAIIDQAINEFNEMSADSLISVVRTHRFFWEQKDNFVTPTNYDYSNRPRRQDWSGQLVENGAIYITSRKKLLESKSRISGKIYPFIMPDYTYYEIDEPDDWYILEKIHQKISKTQIEYSLVEKLKKIQMVVTDVDGVLTNGRMIYLGDDLEGKEFHARDGMGFEILIQNNIAIAIISGESSSTIIRRANKLNVSEVYTAIKDKATIILNLANKFNLNLEQIAFIGDDINDVEAMKLVGLSVAVADAVDEARNVSDIILQSEGGSAAFREFVDLLISKRNVKYTFK